MSPDDQTATSPIPLPHEDSRTTASSEPADPSIGRTIGSYRIRKLITTGGMGAVYLADDTKHGRPVAIKFLLPRFANAIGESRFLREIEFAARLTHPHILPLFDSGAVDGQLYYVMPYIAGESLRAHLDRAKQRPLDEAIRLTREVASALGHAHDHGLIHRDIKPENVLLADGIALVADFGVAQALGNWDTDTAAATHYLTTAGAPIGTPLYMAPEQAAGEPDIDGRADLYALGCTLYEMLAGQPPFTAPTLQALLVRHINDPVPPLASLRPGIPEGIVGVIEKALAKAPADRFPSMARFAEALALTDPGFSNPTAAPGSDVATVPNNLPGERTQFIGREKELASCARLIAGTRLLTLTGIGGCGKTRLALRLAHSMLEIYPDGVWFVDLAPLTDGDLVAQEMAKTLGLTEESATFEDILDKLASASALLMLDNCEHLLDVCADLADRILTKAPKVRLLATSREGLGIEGERAFAVGSLSLPPDASTASMEAISASEAVRLFIDRAAATDQEFVLHEENAVDVAEICRHLDGIPLAIELAAARTRALSVRQIRAMLTDRFRLLTGGNRSSIERHRTLRATLQWSYDHLEPDEQELFVLLSVFAGSWTLDGAAALSGGDSFAVLDRLTRLLDKSLIAAECKSGSDARYRMLETLRQFGLDLLSESGRPDIVRAAHLRYFLDMVEAMQDELKVTYPVAAIARLKLDVENFRLALTWGFQNDPRLAVRLTRGLVKLWYTPGLYAEGRRWYAEALALDDALDSRTRADAHFRSARLSFQLGDYAGALKHYRSTLAIVRDGEDMIKEFRLTGAIANLHGYLGEHEAAERGLEEATRLGERLGDPRRAGRLDNLKGVVRFLRGEWAEARRYFELFLASCRSIEDQDGLQIGLGNLSMVDIEEGKPNLAREHLRECLAINRDLENLYGVAHFLPMLAAAFRLEGDQVTAARLVGAVDALLEQTEAGLEPMQRRMFQQLTAQLRDELGDDTFNASHREGRSLDWREAIELV